MHEEWFNPINGRSYLVNVFQDLLGDWVMVRRWSGSCRSGNQKMAVLSSYADALHQLKSIDGKRRQRGYHRI
jgi:hypothetical protein